MMTTKGHRLCLFELIWCYQGDPKTAPSLHKHMNDLSLWDLVDTVDQQRDIFSDQFLCRESYTISRATFGNLFPEKSHTVPYAETSSSKCGEVQVRTEALHFKFLMRILQNNVKNIESAVDRSRGA